MCVNCKLSVSVVLFHSFSLSFWFGCFYFLPFLCTCGTFRFSYQVSFLPLLSGETKKCLGASVFWGPGAAAAEWEDECWWAAGEDEEAPEGSRPTAQAYPEPRRPPFLFIIAPLVLILTPSISRLGISMLLEQHHTSHSHAWRQPNREWRSIYRTNACLYSV